MIPLCKSTTMTSKGKTYILRPPLHHHDVMSILNEQRRRGDKQLCDVTLAVERRFIVAHKAVLAACSGYFKERFEEKNTTEKKDKNTNQNNSEKSSKKLNPSPKPPMSPPDSPHVKRSRNALSECLPENSPLFPSPASPRSTRTPPPQSFHSRLRPKSSNNLSSFSGEIVVLPGLKSKAFLQILDYMYTSELQIHKENVQDLLFVSCLLQVRAVVDACVKILTKEKKWKITRSTYSWAKETSTIPATSSSQLKSCQQDPNKSLLTSPVITSHISQHRFEVKDIAQEHRETPAKQEVSANQSAGLVEKKASFSPAQARPRGSDVGKVENPDISDSCKLVVTARVDDRAITTVGASQGDNQQLNSFSETDKSDIFAKGNEISDKSMRAARNDERLRRSRTFSDGLYTTHDQNGALDLRQKSKKIERKYSDDISQQIHRKTTSEATEKMMKEEQLKNDLLRLRSTSTDLRQQRKENSASSAKIPVNENNHFRSDNSAFRKSYEGSEAHSRVLPSLDTSLFQPFDLHPLHATINPLLLNNDFLTSQRIGNANEALKRAGMLPNVSVPGFIPSLLWKDPTKLIPLNQLAFLGEQPIRSFDSQQVRSWLGCFEPSSVFKPSSRHSTLYSNCSVKMSASAEFEVEDPARHQLSNAIHKSPNLHLHEIEKQNLQNSTSICEPNKHPLKRKLMMSAALSESESFSADLVQGEPPAKLSPTSVSPSISRFEPLRGPETAVTTRQQQCVM